MGAASVSGTLDYYIRGYDLRTGKEIWRDRLPAGGQATPSTYKGADGQQYLVVAAGGHGSAGSEAGDSIIAYALPNATYSKDQSFGLVCKGECDEKNLEEANNA